MNVPEFVLTEIYIRRRNRWALALQGVEEREKNEYLQRQLDRFLRCFRAGPNSSDANSINAVLALMQMRSMAVLPTQWVDPTMFEQSPIGNEMILAGRFWSAKERMLEARQRKAVVRG